MKRLASRALSILLTFMMVFNAMPVTALAARQDQGNTVNYSVSMQSISGSSEVMVGESITLTSNQGNKNHKWSSDKPEVATVKGDKTSATVTGRSVGTVTIKHTWGYSSNNSETFTVIVVSATVGIESITATPEAMELWLNGAELGLSDRGAIQTAIAPADATESYTYSTSNPDIVTVDENGNVTAVGAGEAVITVASESGKVSATVNVTVREANVASIEVTPETLDLPAGDIGALTANVIMMQEGQEIPRVEWQSDNPAAATVDENGSANITAMAGGLSDSAQVNVTAEITLDQSHVGGTLTKTTISAPTTVSQLTSNLGNYTWTIGGAVVSPDTVITGNTTLVAQEISVATDLLVTPTELNLLGKETQPVTATVIPENAVDKTVRWESLDRTIATVDQKGNVTGVSAGTTTVTATVGNITKEVTVNVTMPAQSQTTEVYIYLKLTLEGVTADGWTVNKDGWYTIGKITVPSSVLKSADGLAEGTRVDVEAIRPYLPSIDLHSVNANVAEGVDLDDIRDWDLHVVDSGANDYLDAGKCWHLDGHLTIRPKLSTLTIKYQYSDGSKAAEDYVRTVPNGSTVPAVTSPGREGYTPDQAVVGPIAITGDRTIVVTYFPTNHTVSYLWTGLLNLTLYDEVGNVVSPVRPATQQYVTGSQYTVDTTYTQGMTLYTHDAYGNKDGSYTFSGWDPSGTQTMPNRNVVIRGRWDYAPITIPSYTVTYIVDGEQDGDVETYANNQSVTVRDTLTRDGYTFNGWIATPENAPTTGTFNIHNNVIYHGSFTPNKASFTIRHYLEGTEDKVAGDQTGEMNVGETLTAAKSEQLYTEYQNAQVSRFDEQESITIVSGADNTITVYYKVPLTIKAKDASKPYDGTALTQPDFDVTGLVNGDAKTNISLRMTAESTITNVGTWPNVIDQDTVGGIPSYYDVTYENGTLEVTKRIVTLKSADLSKPYDGTALENGNEPLEVEDGWVGTDGATYSFTGSQTLVGDSANAFDYTLNAGTNANNYDIQKSEGRLTVTDRTEKYEVTLVANSNLKNTYDGTPKSATGVETDKFTINGVEYTVSGYTTSDPTEVNAGTYPNTISGNYTVTDAENNDVTAQFTVHTTNGELVIAKKTVTLKSADLSKPYDGTALENGNEPLEVEDGWVDGEGATYTFTGTQTLVGSSYNTFEIVPNEGTTLENYDIIREYGLLTITDDAIVPVITKTHDAAHGEYKLDEEVTFNIRVTNLYDEVKTITLNELPGVTFGNGNSEIVFGDVAPGDFRETTATYTITEADIRAGSFTNTVTAVFDGGNSFTATDAVTTEHPIASLAITKTLDPSTVPARGYFIAGETARFIINVSNTGNQTLADVVVTDQLNGAKISEGAGYTVNGNTALIATLTPRQAVELAATYEVTMNDLRADANAPMLRNVVTASGTAPDPVEDPAPVTANADAPVDTFTEITGTKVWNDENNAFGTRPESITLTLLSGETRLSEVQATAASGWTYTFGKLPTHDADGNVIPYVVRDEVTGYDAEMTPDYQVTNNLRRYTLTVRYWYDRVGGMEASATVMRSYFYGQSYNVASPGIRGYRANRARVTGVMTGDITEDVVFRRNDYTITVNYVYQDGTIAAPAYNGTLGYDDAYFIQSPVLTGFTPNMRAVAGSMEGRNLVFTVIYVPDNVTVVIDEYGVPLGIGAVEMNVGDCFE